jgi:hypothetical protein
MSTKLNAAKEYEYNKKKQLKLPHVYMWFRQEFCVISRASI